MLLMCCCKDSVLSRSTSRYFTDSLKGIVFPRVFAISLPTRLRRSVEPTGMISVLSVLSLSPQKPHGMLGTGRRRGGGEGGMEGGEEGDYIPMATLSQLE